MRPRRFDVRGTEELRRRRKRNQTKFSEARPRRRGGSHAQSNRVWTTAA
jgi:hypothetical protein